MYKSQKERMVVYCKSYQVINSFSPLLSFPSMASTPPHNFSFVDPGKLAGLAMPRMTSDYQYLLDHGIKHLVCLCERKPPYYDSCPELQLHHIKIEDFTPPSPSQIDRFLSIVEEANSKGEVRSHITDTLCLVSGEAFKVLSGPSRVEYESSIVRRLTSHEHCMLIHLASSLLDFDKTPGTALQLLQCPRIKKQKGGKA